MNFRDLINFIGSKNIFASDEPVLLAVSGGIDSTVMAHLFHQAKFRFAIAHCNFGLRGNDSVEDAGFVKRLSSQFNVPFFMEKFGTADFASQNGISIQMAARDLRYEWFEKIRKEKSFAYIATAHHLDDQVETFLINLIRGTGIAGLHGIPVKNGLIIRPMMFAFRRDIEQYARQHNVSYQTDHSNNETKYLRNKLRHEVIPLLCSINPEFAQGLTDSIRRLGEYEQIGKLALQNWCKDAMTTNGKDHYLEISHLLSMIPVEPYAWELFSPYGFNETQVSNLLESLKNENRKIFTSKTHRLVKERGKLILSVIEQQVPDRRINIRLFEHRRTVRKPLHLILERHTDVAHYEIPSTGKIASLDFEKLSFPLTVRRWRQGDVFYPLGMKRKKKVSDFFIDQKFTMKEKEQTWLVCSGNDIAWIIGHRIDHRFRVTSATKQILAIMTRDA